MNLSKLMATVCMSVLGSTAVSAGVMEQLYIDENTGFVIGSKDYDSNEIIDEIYVENETVGRKTKQTLKPNTTSSSSDHAIQKVTKSQLGSRSTGTRPDSVVNVSEVVQEIRQPMEVKPAAQDALLSTPYRYLMVAKPSERVFIDKNDGLLYFHLRKGSLKENIYALLSSTRAEQPVMSGISDNHKVSATIWVSGKSVLDILDAILISYEEPYPIVADPYSNRIVEVKYDVKG